MKEKTKCFEKGEAPVKTTKKKEKRIDGKRLSGNGEGDNGFGVHVVPAEQA